MAKLSNAGQICMAPDYVLIPEEQLERFVVLYRSKTAAMFPTLEDNPDYTSIVNGGHYERLRGYLADARARGARVIEINPGNEDFSQGRGHKLPPYLVLEPTDDMAVMQEEIFGPILPVKGYRHIDEAIAYVNGHPRPLALYYFGTDTAERDRVLDRTFAGGVTVNDVMMHYNIPDLPFGGVGASGIGAYRGVHGFRNFSHAKAVCAVPAIDIPSPIEPPYGVKTEILITSMIKS
jgi:coniferyl-aldehyde dehydrogenase